jgi:hypothetical protein
VGRLSLHVWKKEGIDRSDLFLGFFVLTQELMRLFEIIFKLFCHRNGMEYHILIGIEVVVVMVVKLCVINMIQ